MLRLRDTLMILYQLQRQILRALVENRPETSDMEALTNHCGALASGIVRLKSLHPASAAEDLVRAFILSKYILYLYRNSFLFDL